MTACECRCGQETARDFLPGHDQKLRTEIEKRTGGLLQLRTLVDAAESYAHGKRSDDAFTQVVRAVFAKA